MKKVPYLLALLTMVGGVAMAIAFGANETFFKQKIARDLTRNPKLQTLKGAARATWLKKEQSKNWRYYQRFHFHSTGIGAMSLAIILLLGRIRSPQALNHTARYLVAVGGLLYPYVWLLAAMFGPIWGRTQAKETFAIFGYMGGVFMLGLLLTSYQALRYPTDLENGFTDPGQGGN